MCPLSHRPIALTKSNPPPKPCVDDHTHVENASTKNQNVSKSSENSQDKSHPQPHPSETHSADNTDSISSVPPKAKSLFNTSRQTSQSLPDSSDNRKTMTFSLSRSRDLVIRTKHGRGRGILKDRPLGVKVGGGVGNKSHDSYVQPKTTGEVQPEGSNTDVSTSDNVSSNEPPVTNFVEQNSIPSTGQFDNSTACPSTHPFQRETISTLNDQNTSKPGDTQFVPEDIPVSDSNISIVEKEDEKEDVESVDFQGINMLPQFPAGVVAKPRRYSSRRQKTEGGISEVQVLLDEQSGTTCKLYTHVRIVLFV